MGQIIELHSQANRRTEYRYGLYAHRLIANNGEVYTRHFIVVKNRFGAIVHFTRLHNFVGVYDSKIFSPVVSDAENKMRYVCMMMNYVLIDRYGKFRIDHVFKISKEALDCFFRDYAQDTMPNGSYRGKQSVEKCVHAVTMFFRKLRRKFGASVLVKDSDLVVDTVVYSKHGRPIQRKRPAFQVKGFVSHKTVFRELPTKAFKMLINLAFRYAPDIAFAICLQAFAGLRAGEAMNVRQEGSPLGNGLILTYFEDEIRKVEIDLTKELPLRSDGVICGKIKKERKQHVYPSFIKAFEAAYTHHKTFLSERCFEGEYCPMFINSQGNAMTYEVYKKRFSALIDNHLRPALLASNDPECRIYGQLLLENELGTHALRHWFTVQLVLRGEDVAQIQYWRGDKTPESALLYLQNKGDLVRELEDTSCLLSEIFMSRGERAIERYDGI
jgi:integrase